MTLFNSKRNLLFWLLFSCFSAQISNRPISARVFVYVLIETEILAEIHRILYQNRVIKIFPFFYHFFYLIVNYCIFPEKDKWTLSFLNRKNWLIVVSLPLFVTSNYLVCISSFCFQVSFSQEELEDWSVWNFSCCQASVGNWIAIGLKLEAKYD